MCIKYSAREMKAIYTLQKNSFTSVSAYNRVRNYLLREQKFSFPHHLVKAFHSF